MEQQKLRIALSKGRLLDEELELLNRIGLKIEIGERGLSFETETFSFWLIKPYDVPTWVESGVVDLGIVGLDVVRETVKDVLELMDLGIGRCRFSLACREELLETDYKSKRVLIATKFPNLTRQYVSKIFRDFEIIHLHGSVEIAPQAGLAHFITDLVSTGKTLKENNLVEVSVLCEISAYLIANRTSFIVKYGEIDKFLKIVHRAIYRDTFLFL